MGKEALVEGNIEDGKRLIIALSNAGFPIKTALWNYFDESEEWRLVIESPLVAQRGPIAAYNWVQSVLDQISPKLALELSDVSLHASAADLIDMRWWIWPSLRRPQTQVLDSPDATGIKLHGAYIYNVQHIIGNHDSSALR